MDPLTIALAIYGGYQGYSSAKKAHANTLGQIFGTALGAYGGYSLGNGIGGLMNAGEAAGSTVANTAVGAGVEGGIGALANQPASLISPGATSLMSDEAARQSAMLGQSQYGISNLSAEAAGLGKFNQLPVVDQFAGAPTGGITPNSTVQTSGIKTLAAQPTGTITSDIAGNPRYVSGANVQNMGIDAGGINQTLGEIPKNNQSFTDKFLYKQVWNPATQQYQSGDVNTMNLLLGGGVGALGYGYLSGAFDPVPKNSYMYGSNTLVPTLEKNREFYVQDPKTGQTKAISKPFTTEEYNMNNPPPDSKNIGPYQVTKFQSFNNGGLASLSHFREGGINYLPSKTLNDEDNEANYVRANGYVADATGAGNKDVDTMLAQLADGEFVTRTDGILGAGILAGADPSDEKQMRKMGADFFYEQQKRFKRIFDLLDASRKATQH